MISSTLGGEFQASIGFKKRASTQTVARAESYARIYGFVEVQLYDAKHRLELLVI